ncbi:hypothetical protein FQA39_LY06116 [Lamprigera yunnana]|nr:hypothetical protein FQA39_LY06116 [Lamprigera yunnana]
MLASPVIILHVGLRTDTEFYLFVNWNVRKIWPVFGIHKTRQRVMVKYNEVAYAESYGEKEQLMMEELKQNQDVMEVKAPIGEQLRTSSKAWKKNERAGLKSITVKMLIAGGAKTKMEL